MRRQFHFGGWFALAWLCGVWSLGGTAVRAENPFDLNELKAQLNAEVLLLQFRDLQPAVPAAPGAGGNTPNAQPAEDDGEADDAGAGEPAEVLPPQFMRLHLLDGTIVSGDLSITEIEVATEFGKLVVPISRIVSFTPGLESHPQIAEKIDDLIETLGGDDHPSREAAHKELVRMGLSVRPLLVPHKDDENAQRKQHIEQILKEFEELAEDADDFDSGSGTKTAWTPQDTVVTPEFTIVGRVSPPSFELTNQYGTLTVRLADLRTGQRDVGKKEPVQRRIMVSGSNLVQREFKSTGVRVERGDRVTVRAEGQIVMSPWGSNAISGPDGAPNYGWYIANQIPGGTLVARIGSNGEVFKVGSQHTFVAKKSGTLNFAVAMQGEYSGQGYQFPGQYSVKVTVAPQ